MLRNGLLVLAALTLLPAMAMADTRGPWELTLSGSAANGSRFNGVSGGLAGSIGYFFGDNLELAARQTVTYNDTSAPVTLNGGTDVAADFHIPLGDQGQFVPYGGANIGYLYGKNDFRDTFEAGPEAGIKFFVNSTTFIFVNAQYEFFFRRGSNAGQSFKDGQFVYGLGIGFRF